MNYITENDLKGTIFFLNSVVSKSNSFGLLLIGMIIVVVCLIGFIFFNNK